jgi:hypothetical protein
MVCWDIRINIQALVCFSWPVYPSMVVSVFATRIVLVCPDQLDSGDWKPDESPSEAVGARGFVAPSEHNVAGKLFTVAGSYPLLLRVLCPLPHKFKAVVACLPPGLTERAFAS